MDNSQHLLFAALAAFALVGCSGIQEARFKATAHESFDDVLFDAESARFRNERVVWARGSDHDLALCGEVNAKNRMGAYVGWQKFVVEGHVYGSSKPFTVGPLIEDTVLESMYREKRAAYCGDY